MLATLFGSTSGLIAHAQLPVEGTLLAGLLHPMSGLDHTAVMVSLGCIAGLSKEKKLLALPAAFLGGQLAGCLAGLSGVTWGITELAVLLTVALSGGALALRQELPAKLALAAAVFFGLLHGHAHGQEWLALAGSTAHVLGMLAGSGLLLAIGLGLGQLLAARPAFNTRWLGLAPLAVCVWLICG